MTPPAEPSDDASEAAVPEGALAGLMTRIRAKYRLVCSLVGVKPRLTVRNTAQGDVMADNAPVDAASGIEGASNNKGNQEAGPQVDSRLLQF